LDIAPHKARKGCADRPVKLTPIVVVVYSNTYKGFTDLGMVLP